MITAVLFDLDDTLLGNPTLRFIAGRLASSAVVLIGVVVVVFSLLQLVPGTGLLRHSPLKSRGSVDGS